MYGLSSDVSFAIGFNSLRFTTFLPLGQMCYSAPFYYNSPVHAVGLGSVCVCVCIVLPGRGRIGCEVTVFCLEGGRSKGYIFSQGRNVLKAGARHLWHGLGPETQCL